MMSKKKIVKIFFLLLVQGFIQNQVKNNSWMFYSNHNFLIPMNIKIKPNLMYTPPPTLFARNGPEALPHLNYGLTGI